MSGNFTHRFLIIVKLYNSVIVRYISQCYFAIGKVVLKPSVLVVFYSHKTCEANTTGRQAQYHCEAITLAFKRIKLLNYSQKFGGVVV